MKPTNWGGQIQDRGDGHHATLWRAGEEGGKGERLSWDMKGNPGQPTNLHHTNQDDGTHSSDPKDWRTGEEMLGGGCLGLIAVVFITLATLAASLIILL